MKILSILVALCSLSCISCVDSESVVRGEFELFKITHGKKYVSEEEELHRLKTFAANKKVIAEHNALYEAGEVSFKMGLNHLSDMTLDEITSTMMGHNPTVTDGIDEEVFNGDGMSVAASFDWRDYNAVTPVKNQGFTCGSCWAFSAAGALESHTFLKYGRLVPLSEQNIVDCAIRNGCDGSVMTTAFDYIKANGGVDTERSYPYEGHEGPCRFTKENIGAQCKGYRRIPSRNEGELQKAIYNAGPTTVAVNANLTSFHNYETGIYFDKNCVDNLTHEMLAVGYDQDSNGNEYWIVKNSWGEDWGENGYMKLARNRNNHCGVASDAAFPLI